MAATNALGCASPIAPEDGSSSSDVEEVPRGPLAWIENAAVSPLHCEIYSVLFAKNEQCPPLLYVRDCQSTSGTYVNGQLVGQGRYVTAARLLENNDAISVGPCTLRICEYPVPATNITLTSCQKEEATLFADEYVLKDTVIGYGAFANCKKPPFGASSTMFTFGELATGGDLFSLLERERFIPEIEIKWIATQLLGAVDYLHCKGVAHRDIKPENILCTSSLYMHHRIALADFGCAGVASFGRMTSYVGTKPYRAPEVQSSNVPHKFSVDIWAVGIVMLQLLAGAQGVEMLADSQGACEQLIRVLNTQRAGVRKQPISQEGVDFILACLNPNSHERPTAAAAAKHPWLSGSEQERTLFRERKKQLAWKPRDIVIPAVVDLRRATVREAQKQTYQDNDTNDVNSMANDVLGEESQLEDNSGNCINPQNAPADVKNQEQFLAEGEDDVHKHRKPVRRCETTVGGEDTGLVAEQRTRSTP
ncbi:Myosin light chain kinase-related protein [Niveomyces insectorum RCEF 264]|uniref:Myosin light chain kinase-related protein n=1 Tax=Niveomyces insectorum RCEF 264 TaxID=1081102 RepID=A0A162IC98_9HYPO|nr:Myosin light chain kinase-related protein [Niveomyces insectorum RCEF 264]